MAESCMEVCFTQLWVIAVLSTNTSQGSVAMQLRFIAVLNYRFARNLLLIL